MAEAQASGQRQPVQWNGPEAVETEKSELDIEREKHARRAAKFGTEYVEPTARRDLRLQSRRERLQRPGFATGIDLFSPEEIAKCEARAAKFGATDAALSWAPPEDLAKRAQRAARFGTEFAPAQDAMMDVDLLESRREPSLSHALRPDAVYVYGVDLLSTADVLRVFGDYGPRFVEWINDSSCVVLFADGPGAKRAVAGLGRPLPPDPGSELQGLDPADPSNMEYMWHQVVIAGGAGDEQQRGTEANGALQNPLLLRIATTEDVRAEGRVQSRRLWQDRAHGSRGRAAGRHRRQRHDGDQEAMDDDAQEGGDARSRGRGLGVRRQGKTRKPRPNTEGAILPGPNALFKRALGEVVASAPGQETELGTRQAVNYADL